MAENTATHLRTRFLWLDVRKTSWLPWIVWLSWLPWRLWRQSSRTQKLRTSDCIAGVPSSGDRLPRIDGSLGEGLLFFLLFLFW